MTAERISINDAKIVHETVDGEVIVINLETGAYYGLRGSALETWNLIQSGRSGQVLVDAVAARYGIAASEVEPGVREFMDSLQTEEIILIESSDAPPAEVSAAETDPPPAAPFAPPKFTKHTNMSDLLLLDPIHDVDEQGWPHERAG